MLSTCTSSSRVSSSNRHEYMATHSFSTNRLLRVISSNVLISSEKRSTLDTYQAIAKVRIARKVPVQDQFFAGRLKVGSRMSESAQQSTHLQQQRLLEPITYENRTFLGSTRTVERLAHAPTGPFFRRKASDAACARSAVGS